MAQDDYQLLEDYTEWQEEKLLHEGDTSVEAFKAEREAGANSRRIEKVRNVVSEALNKDYATVDNAIGLLFAALETANSALEADRPYVEIRSLTSPFITREYTD